MTRDQFIEQLKRHEGFRSRVYIDSVGVPTGGWGHAFHVGSTLPIKACEELFNHDVSIAVGGFASLGFPIMDTARRYALTNMIFNLGLEGFMGFKKMIAAIRLGDWETAAKEALNSKWADQVGYRASEISEMLRNGTT